jgi:hypothetical protein
LVIGVAKVFTKRVFVNNEISAILPIFMRGSNARQNSKTMTELQEMVFIGEIVLQSKIAQRAAERLPDSHNNFDKVEVWCSIQSILVAAGNVSKILWPQTLTRLSKESLC